MFKAKATLKGLLLASASVALLSVPGQTQSPSTAGIDSVWMVDQNAAVDLPPGCGVWLQAQATNYASWEATMNEHYRLRIKALTDSLQHLTTERDKMALEIQARDLAALSYITNVLPHIQLMQVVTDTSAADTSGGS